MPSRCVHSLADDRAHADVCPGHVGSPTRARQEARDNEDHPKQAVIALIVNASQAKVEAAAREAATQRAVKAELQQLKMPDLRKRAAAAGASADTIEDARDADDPKAEMIALILAHQSSQP